MYFGLLIVAWALQIAWIARVATDRGRSVLVWATVGAAVGLAGLFASEELISGNVEPLGGNTRLLATFVAPLALLVLPMAGLAIWISRSPAHAARRNVWKVHSAKRGGATLSFEGDRITIEWREGRDEIALAELKRCSPDGECVRLAWGDSEHVLMPLEKPDTRAGRQAQSRALAAQLEAGRRSAHPAPR